MSRASILALLALVPALLAGCPEPPQPGTGGEAGSAGAGGSDAGIVCEVGWYDCDHDPANGCEAHVGSSPLNCGGCGVVCSYANAYPACVSGVCALDTCYQGHGDCDGDPANGCEADLTTDHDNCGGCGIKCEIPHAAAACFAGSCAMLGCDPGWGSCVDMPGDGCETNLDSDPLNCGACGKACGAGETCKDGVCLPPGCLSSCCPGCIDGNADCVTGTTHNACGSHGGACVNCASNQVCANGVCAM